MARLHDDQLANIARWCWDFEMAFRLYTKTAEVFSDKQDYYATVGALEGAIISQELMPRRWSTPPDHALEKILGHEKYSLVPKQAQSDRAKRFGDLVQDEQKKISDRIDEHKSRLRQVSSELRSKQSKDTELNKPSTLVYREWFIAVQRLSSFSFGRMYRRDGIPPELARISRVLTALGLRNDYVDERFVSLMLNEISVEIWFDGRVSCVATVRQFDEVIPTLKEIADTCEKAMQEGHEDC